MSVFSRSVKVFIILALLSVLPPGSHTLKKDNTNEIFKSIHKEDLVRVNVLLADGADVDAVDESGNTPLILAIKIGNPRMIKLILAHNPDVNKRNKDGQTAFMIADHNGLSEIADQLKKVSADTSSRRSVINEA